MDGRVNYQLFPRYIVSILFRVILRKNVMTESSQPSQALLELCALVVSSSHLSL